MGMFTGYKNRLSLTLEYKPITAAIVTNDYSKNLKGLSALGFPFLFYQQTG